MDKINKAIFDANDQCCDIMNNLINENTMEKINVAELLKNCPVGMELDCTMWDNVTFEGIENVGYINILIKNPDGIVKLSNEGCFTHNCNSAKCIIFPKGKTTWEGFHRPFKDGDIIYIRDEYSDATFTYVAILKHVKGGQVYSHCFYNYEYAEFSTEDYLYDIYRIRFATEEEKQKLFQAIKDNGYKWNEETKTLDKLIPNKFDITSLKPFDKILARDTNRQIWIADLFSHNVKESFGKYGFSCIGHYWHQCIPYEGNEHLLGTTNDCSDYFKTWK